jgi:hypothetical protein
MLLRAAGIGHRARRQLPILGRDIGGAGARGTGRHRIERCPMTASSDPRPESAGTRRTGLVLSGLVSLFLLADGGARLAGFAPYVEGLTKFGYAPTLAPWIGLSLLLSTVLYIAPRTSVLGAILVASYLGGATATQVHVGDPWFLFPVASA